VSDTAAATRSLRRRLTVIATIAIALLLATTATLLLGLQRRQLVHDVDERLGERADGLSAMLADGTSSIAGEPADEDRAVQVVDEAGNVIVASANLPGRLAVADPPEGRQVIRTVDHFPVDDGDFRVLSRRVEAGDAADDAVILHVAESIDDIDENVRVLAGSLLLAFPIVLAVLAALTWWLVGRTLRPVEAAAARQERFVADASHELRSPLARIRTRLEVDLAHPEGADLRDGAGDVLAETRGMERLVDDLLHLARADAETGRRTRRDDPLVDLDDVVLAEAAAARETAAVTIDTSAVSGATVRGRRDDLARLVRNLLDNAVTHATGQVRVSLSTTGRDAVLAVDDDGDGIPPVQRADVFERFGRLDEARASGGTGLGLAIALEIARSHGGTIDVGDAPMGGARFVVVLPAA
jgi:signal transduction histidine kinase